MPAYLLASFLALVALATAQLDLPTCALSCFDQAIGNTTCSATDYYCQCTTGQTQIQALAIPCLCHSTCTSSDLIAVIQDSNKVCSSALSASSQTYTAATIGLGACATAGSESQGQGAAASSTGTASGGSATGTGTPTATAAQTTAVTGSSGSGSATGSAATSTGSSGAMVVKVVYGEVVLGVAGLMALAL